MEYIRLIVAGSTNSYIVFNENKDAIIIDPGAEANRIINTIEKEGLNVEAILLTHAHGDHIGALDEVREHFKVEVYLHSDELIIYENDAYNFAPYMGGKSPSKAPDHFFLDGDILEFKTGTFEILHTPGHTPGSSCFIINKLIFTGDTLFQGSIGRTDFPMGDWDIMVKSLKRFFSLDEELVVLSGHGEATTISIEKRINPFLTQIQW